MILWNTEVLLERGKEKIGHCKVGDRIDTPNGFCYIAKIYSEYSHYLLHWVFSNKEVICGKKVTFYNMEDLPYRKNVKPGEKVKSKSGFVLLNKLGFTKDKRKIVTLEVLSDCGKYYVGDLLVA